MRKLTIAIDFDNTITVGAGQFPKCGKLRKGAKETINSWIERGHDVIINTCRNSVDKAEQTCIDFLTYNGVRYSRINTNSPLYIQKYGSDTRKISADIYFDDKGTVVDFAEFDAIIKKMEKPTIIAIVGESGSGKSMAADYIKETFGIALIQSRTTRKQRDKSDTGHLFVTNKEFDSYKKEEMIAFTEFGGNRYCCLHSDVSEWSNTYVIDETGLKYLTKNFADRYNIFSIRMLRAIEARIADVGKERVGRDKGKFTMKNEEFSTVIANVTNVKEDLFSMIDDVITKNMLYL